MGAETQSIPPQITTESGQAAWLRGIARAERDLQLYHPDLDPTVGMSIDDIKKHPAYLAGVQRAIEVVATTEPVVGITPADERFDDRRASSGDHAA